MTEETKTILKRYEKEYEAEEDKSSKENDTKLLKMFYWGGASSTMGIIADFEYETDYIRKLLNTDIKAMKIIKKSLEQMKKIDKEHYFTAELERRKSETAGKIMAYSIALATITKEVL